LFCIVLLITYTIKACWFEHSVPVAAGGAYVFCARAIAGLSTIMSDEGCVFGMSQDSKPDCFVCDVPITGEIFLYRGKEIDGDCKAAVRAFERQLIAPEKIEEATT